MLHGSPPTFNRGAGLAYSELTLNLPWGLAATLISSQLAQHASWVRHLVL